METNFSLLAGLSTATVGAAQNEKRIVSADIKPLFIPIELAGPAYPVNLAPGHNLSVHHALTTAPSGAVLVICTGADTSRAVIGDLIVAAAGKRGLVGIITDGCIRDSRAIRNARFPVFCAGVNIRGMDKALAGTVNQPVVLGGVEIRPGDLIVADDDGIIVIDPVELADVAKKCRERDRREEEIRVGIEQGKTTVELLNLK